MERTRKQAVGVSAVLMVMMLTLAVLFTTLAVNSGRKQPLEKAPDTQEVQTQIVFGMPFNVPFDVIKGFDANELQLNVTSGQWTGNKSVKIAVGRGTPVLATYGGTITRVTNDSLEGTIVEITHRDGLVTRYLGLDSNLSVKRGDTVTRGQPIGTVSGRPVDNKDGPHVKLEVLRNNEKVNPADYIPNLDGGNK
jgi:stage II sporulation protein Q